MELQKIKKIKLNKKIKRQAETFMDLICVLLFVSSSGVRGEERHGNTRSCAGEDGSSVLPPEEKKLVRTFQSGPSVRRLVGLKTSQDIPVGTISPQVSRSKN